MYNTNPLVNRMLAAMQGSSVVEACMTRSEYSEDGVRLKRQKKATAMRARKSPEDRCLSCGVQVQRGIHTCASCEAYLDAKLAKIAATARVRSDPILTRLLQAKAFSDKSRYTEKAQILRELMQAEPDNWMIDDPTGKYYGMRYIPHNFRIHADRRIVPQTIVQRMIDQNSSMPQDQNGG